MLEVPLLLLYGGSVANVHGGAAVWAQTRALIPGLLVGLMWARGAGRDQPVPRVPERPARLRDRGGRDRAAAHLHPRRDPAPGRDRRPSSHAGSAGGPVGARGAPPAPSLAEKVSGLFSPFTLFDGVRMWLGGTNPADNVPSPGAFGAVYALVLIALVGLCLAGLGRPLPEGAPVMTTIELRNVSRWYGNVVAVNDITMDIGPGVTGLLGPNGAGKSTILHMMAGFLEPSKGTLTVDGAPTWKNPEIYRKLGLVPERDSVYAFLTGDQFVTATAKLHKLPDPERAAQRAIDMTEMSPAQAPQDLHLLQGHAPAHQGRRRPRPRPGDPAARRAVQRHGPQAAPAHDGPARPGSATRAARSSSPPTSSKRWSGSPARSR